MRPGTCKLHEVGSQSYTAGEGTAHLIHQSSTGDKMVLHCEGTTLDDILGYELLDGTKQLGGKIW